MERVEHLLRKKFYEYCTKHNKVETLVCKDCLSDPFCEDCMCDPFCDTCSEHTGHELLQVFKASRKEVIRVTDIEKFWNVSNVQPFVINAHDVVYIHERKTKGEPGCRICGGHKLHEKYAFCSLECQLGSLQIEGNKDLNLHKRFSSGGAFSSSSSVVSSNSPFVKHKRKGRPVRAPLY